MDLVRCPQQWPWTRLLNCKGVANGSHDLSTEDKMSCDKKVDKVSKNSGMKSENDDSTSSNDDDDTDQSNGVESKTNSVLTAGPAVASPDDHIIKPINLNKGTESDEPLKTNNDKNKKSAESSPKHIFQDKLDLRDQFDKIQIRVFQNYTNRLIYPIPQFTRTSELSLHQVFFKFFFLLIITKL